MSLAQFFRFAGLTTLVLGSSFILYPNEILTFFDGQGIADQAHFIRFLGTALIGFSVLNWYGVRLTHNAEAILIALVANFTSLILATTIDLIMFSTDMLSERSYLILALHLSFAYGFGYWIYRVRGQLLSKSKKYS